MQEGTNVLATMDAAQAAQHIKGLDVTKIDYPALISGGLELLNFASQLYTVWQQFKIKRLEQPNPLLEGVQTSILNTLGGLFKDQAINWLKTYLTDPAVQKAILDKISEAVTFLLSKVFTK